MTTIAAPIIKDQELMPHGLVESASVKSLTDFVSSNSNETEEKKEKEVNDFINTFVCHLIFYTVFCISLVLHILIDLGLGSFVKSIFFQFIDIAKNLVIEKNTAFA